MMKIYSTFQLFARQSAFKVLVFFTGLLFSAGLYSQTPCNEPLNAAVMSVTTSGATITWTPPNPAPWNGYDYWYTNIQGYFPVGGPTPKGTVSTPSLTLSQFTNDATIYVYIRSKCNPTSSTWDGPISFTTLSGGDGCPNGQYGVMPAETFTPEYTGSPEVITAQGYAGQFSRVKVKPYRQYLFSSSNANDYITITADNASVLASGASPLIYNSYLNETIRFYTTTNSSCGGQQTNRTRFVQAQLIPSNCVTPSDLYTTSITNTSAKVLWTDNSSGPNSLHLYYATGAATPNINATPSETVSGTNYTITDLSPNTTYYYWMRKVCGQDLSSWVSGGSFTTQAAEVNGCTGALYGQDPSETFIPVCSGSPETITTSMWAGNFSVVKASANKIYTFTSTVATDFFTIRDEFTSVAYASGTTPLVWSSGANVANLKVFLHTNSTCGNQEVNRTVKVTCQQATGCAAPGSISFLSIGDTSAHIKWADASPAPAGGYQYFYSTSSTAPGVTATPSGITDISSLYLNGLQNNTIYYFWVRSNCGNAQSPWIFGNVFTTVGAGGGCTSFTEKYPAEIFAPVCFGNDEVIVTDAFAGEYTEISINPNTKYTFKSSVSSDFITITNSDASYTYLKGFSPLVWSSGDNGGTIRYYFHNNASCGMQGGVRTRYIACQAATSCGAPSGINISQVTATGASLNWLPVNPSPIGGYQYYYSIQNNAPQVSTPPAGNVSSASFNLSGLTEMTTYYIWLRSNCGAAVGSWILGGSFTTSALPFCNTAEFGQYPDGTITPLCSGMPQLIAEDAFAGEYSNISVTAGKAYTFSSSTATDFITITNAAGTVKFAQGVTPLTWNSSNNAGTVRYYLHANSSCGSEQVNRSRYINCEGGFSCPAPSGVILGTVTTSSVTFSWTATVPAPSSGYQYYFSTTSTVPTVSTTPSGSVLSPSVTIPGLTINTTYYFWVRANCGSMSGEWVSGGSFNTAGTGACNPPGSIQFFDISATAATVMWTNAVPSPSNGYNYYYSTSNVAPTVSTAPSGSTTGGGNSLTNLQSNTVYYVWVRSNCGTTTSQWVSGGSFTTSGTSVFCNAAVYGLFPEATFVPACTGNAQLIANNAYAGEYANVTISPNTQYTFSSSVNTDFITVTNASGSALLSQGVTPLVWNSASNSGTVRYYLHTDSACGDQDANRSRYITCAGTTTNCGAPSNLASSNITSNSAALTFTGSSSLAATYDVYFGTLNVTPTAATTPSGNVDATDVILTSLQSAATYYFWIRSNCAGSNSAWISGGSFATNPALTCNGSAYGLYPVTTFTPVCGGASETIVSDAYAGEFSNISVSANKKYTFSSSVTSDFITVTNAAGNVVIASGTSPLVWISGSNSGIFRYFIHANSSCASLGSARVRYVACEPYLGADEFEKEAVRIFPNPANDVVTIIGEAISKIELISVSGQLVKTFLLNANQTQIQISDIASGMYFARIHAAGKTETRKIIKK